MLIRVIESVDVDPNSAYAAHLARARREALKSPDPSTKVGAFLLCHAAGAFMNSQGVGAFNRFASLKEVDNATREERYEDVIHAEENLIIEAGHKMRGGTVFMTHEPCSKCWRLLVTAGVRKVVFLHTDDERRERWRCASGRAVALLAGLELEEVYP